MCAQKKNPLKQIKVTKIIYPILIGVLVVGFLLYRNYKPGTFSAVNFSISSIFWLLLAILLMAFRDVGYVIRLKLLSDGKLNWLQSIRIIMLWEFTSAITPSAIGGTSVAILYIHKEGLKLGQSSALVLATSFLDELYFILMFPLLLLVIKPHELFIIDGTESGAFSLSNEFFYFAIIGYSLKFLYTLVVSYGLFFNPRGLKWLLLMIFRLPILRRWRHGANEAGSDIISSSKELKKKPFVFWLRAFAATFFSWTSRYWVVNALIMAFFVTREHVLIFARQLVMWIMMLVAPTPGGSGFSEFVFSRYLGGFFPVPEETVKGVAIAMAFLWRFISYYPYLIIGAIIFPIWLRKKFASGSAS